MRLNGTFLTILIFTSSIAAAAPGADLRRNATPAAAELNAVADGDVVTSRATGAVRSASFRAGAVVADGVDVTEKAELFMLRHGPAFGVELDRTELGTPVLTTDRFDRQRMVFSQQLRGVPVFGARVALHFDRSGELVRVDSTAVPSIALASVTPTIDLDSAAELMRSHVAKQHDSAAEMLELIEGELVVFNDGVIWGRPGQNHLAWDLVIGDGGLIRERLFIDAHSGRLIEQITESEEIRRQVFEHDSNNLVWDEGDPFPYSGSGPGRDEEINNLILTSARTYDIFLNLSSGDFVSWNGSDGSMRHYYDRDGMSCPNAYFNGSSTSYCVGTATDDVIAHEWTHGYTRSTHGLIYAWQSGALNEAYSDIFGEVVDLLYDSGTDTPSTVREDEVCSAATAGSRAEMTVDQPSSLAGPYDIGSATFNPAPPWSITGTVEIAEDGVGLGNDACEELVDFTPGKVALITMAACDERFLTPVLNAEAAGAVAAIIVNPLNDNVITMTGAGATSIPAVFLGRSDGDLIRDAVDQGVVVTMSAGGEGSLRWLIGEDSSAFGGAIRDMWNPECLGDPGRVFSSRYYCGEGDNGGVHINSGVPNRAFALLVDGGTANGVEVPSIGMTRAAHIYWRAMSVYQLPLSDFRDHADFLGVSCRDLIGIPLPDLLTGLTSPETISQTHCEAVELAMTATEMRQWPTQCGFDTILDPDPPFVPGEFVVLEERFDTRPAGWTLSNEGVYGEYVPRDWVWTDQVPDGGDGGAFYAENNPELGNCRAGSDDQSGVVHLDSPVIQLPNGSRPVLRFDHYVATEDLVDGGNVKISVNGAPFEVIDSESFLFNAYNSTLRGTRNDNPLAGEDAFVGTNETTYRGSWGQSQIRLDGYADPGDSIVLRFDFGTDGCGGQDGWYVDNVRLTMEPRSRTSTGRVASAP